MQLRRRHHPSAAVWQSTRRDEAEATDDSIDCDSESSVSGRVYEYLVAHHDRVKGVLRTSHSSDIRLELFHGGATNFCFRVWNARDHDSCMFVKYAQDYVRGFSEWAVLSRRRVWYEAEGFKQIAKHDPSAVPRVHLVDEEMGILATEYLHGYRPLYEDICKGREGHARLAGALARMAANLHADSMSSPEIVALNAQKYTNQPHIDFWSKCFFPPLHDALRDPHTCCTKPEQATLVEDLNADGVLSTAVDRLYQAYSGKKQALVHADLHCKNILLRDVEHDPRALDFKVIDAEKFMAGPAGLDLAQMAANYVWHMAIFSTAQHQAPPHNHAHTDTHAHHHLRNMSHALSELWSTYVEHLRLRMEGCGGENVDAWGVVDDIVNDAVGLMGLWIVFLNIACPVEMMEVALDTTDAINNARGNLIRLSAAALRNYLEGPSPLKRDPQYVIDVVTSAFRYR